MTTDEEIFRCYCNAGISGEHDYECVLENMKLARENERKEALADCADSHDDMLEEKEKEIQTLLARTTKLENALKLVEEYGCMASEEIQCNEYVSCPICIAKKALHNGVE